MVDIQSAGVGATVQTGEIDDNAITTAKIADGAVTAPKISGIGFSVVKAAGTIGITNANFDNDYIDLSFSAAELGANDVIEISLFGAANQTQVKFNCTDTGSDGDIIPATNLFPTAEGGEAKITISQDHSSNSTIRGFMRQYYDYGSGTDSEAYRGGIQDTTDTNIFTTAFNIRMNFLTAAGGSFRYIVNIIKGA